MDFELKYLRTKTTCHAGKVILLSLFAVLLWTNPAFAFKSYASGEFYHKTLTHQGLKDVSGVLKASSPDKTIGFSPAAILAVQKAARHVEGEDLFVASGESELKDGESHCDNEQLLACSARILKNRKDILAILTAQPLPQNAGPIAWKTLGKVLHMVQDYYSHSNWVERGNTQTNDYLLGNAGKAGGLLPPTELPPKPSANVAPACQPASPGSEILNLADYPTSGFSLRGNICDVITAHPGRCVHGCTGPLCEQTPNSTCAGMNKDTSDELGGHTQGRHQIAANLAIQATTQLVNQIIGELQSRQGLDQDQKDEALCAFLGSNACASVLPIIPGLVGAGVGTPAGSGPNRVGGSIIHVTTLGDSGAGSLREALEASGPRIVVFDVSGYIALQSRIKILEPFLTIAGQTAPFPGISIRDSGLQIKTHDVLIQHIRIRIGDAPNGEGLSRDAIVIRGDGGGAYNIVVDHISASWATDENMSTFSTVHDVTVANSINSEGLWHSIHPKGPHSRGFLVNEDTQNLLVIGNLLAHNHQRNMRVKGNTDTLFINNIVYNWRGAGGTTTGGASEYGGVGSSLKASIVGNVYVRGLDSRSSENSHPVVLRSDVEAGSQVFIDDTESDTSTIGLVKTTENVEVNTSPNWISNLTARKSNVVKNWILGNVGARRADGDPVDLRILNDVKNGTGRIIDSQDDVGGWPPLANNVRSSGSIPELDIPLNPHEIQPSGYTKVEEWLHYLAKQVEVPK